jgi:ribosomal protein S20
VENAVTMLNTLKKQLDKIGSKHIFHKNKVARLKSKYDKMVNKLKA